MPSWNTYIANFYASLLRMKCKEEGALEEEESKFSETSLQINCFITHDTKYMMTGINSKFSEVITKRSPTLDRDAEYMRTVMTDCFAVVLSSVLIHFCFILKSKVSRLPAYICVQMVRFFYKEKEKVNAKILKVIPIR